MHPVHCAKAGQINEVDTIVLCQGLHIAYSPACRAGEAMHQNRRLTFSQDLIADTDIFYLHDMMRWFERFLNLHNQCTIPSSFWDTPVLDCFFTLP